ncbi:MAG: DVUA0089 family protein [Myxococcales bacterium]|nr:DVUA0089 family protein [Myxococcales bacterium]
MTHSAFRGGLLLRALVLVACPPPVVSRCGDGAVTAPEACDDGNTADGDGCSATCTVEAPIAPCGNGSLAAPEACDDGNGTSGDGCSSACQLEAGFTCTGEPSVCVTRCGDGVTAGAEACDDGNTTSADGCTSSCRIEPGYSCAGTPSVCVLGCGDGMLRGGEACDDANLTSGDGCSATCTLEPGFTCSGQPSQCTAICGDGRVASTEGCDDGNTAPGDGCSATCVAEPGFSCSGAPSVCAAGCGDGTVAGAEQCDDGNMTAGDGCTACRRDPGFVCTGMPSVCTVTCGDGLIGGAERCDDQNTTSGDGCSASCLVEMGFVCVGAPSVCTSRCGDGVIISPAEQCDDGNTAAADGCDSSCQVTQGFTCSGAPSVCVTRCGDGIPAGTEACDDGNMVRFDGCTNACTVDLFDESEPNGTVATADGPFPVNVAVRASIGPLADDVDLFTFTLTATTDLTLETFDETGPGRCFNLDTVVTLLGPGGTSTLFGDDDSGLERCSRMSSKTTPALRGLPPGSYVVEVRAYAAYRQIPQYRLVVTTDAVCQNMVVEGSEQCDGSATCTASCRRTPSCGDGFVDGTERCDDGNTTPSDGCSATCDFETRVETEPNATSAQASGPFVVDALLSGAITPAGDRDLFAITLPRTADLKIETFDAMGPGSCAGIDTMVTLLAADGTTVIAARDQGGLGNCAALDPAREADAAVRQLAAGTYYVRVNEFLDDGVISGYRVRISQSSRCGNSVVEGFEACDGSMGCTASCTRTPVCGDGFVDAPESCDDGNTLPMDGCSATCASESVMEVEPNNTPAQAGAPRAPFFQVQGSLPMGSDLDVYAIAIPATADLLVETFDASGQRTCLGIDTTLTLLAPNGTTVLATRQGGGPGLCAAIDPKTEVGARQLAAGTYFVRVEDNGQNTPIPGYVLTARLDSRCGNMMVEGFEQCDGTSGCTATCAFAPVCGNGFVESGETCDDGNLMSGDGCSMACAIERMEVEPNDSLAQATTAMPVPVTGWVRGGLTAADVDTWRIVLATPRVIQLETFGTASSGCGIATTLSLLDSAGLPLLVDDNSGIESCSSMTASLPAGTWFVQVRGRTPTTVIGAYLLAVRGFADQGTETEPNGLRSMATMLTGTNLVVVGSHQQNLDVDVFGITVPAGRTLRVETLEGGAETCESSEVDSFVTLFTPSGLALGWDDDSGRGLCSLIDGTGALPLHPWASRLSGGSYFVQVEAAPFAQLATNTRGQFDYRLVISVR